jgi:hypothetical protein
MTIARYAQPSIDAVETVASLALCASLGGVPARGDTVALARRCLR